MPSVPHFASPTTAASPNDIEVLAFVGSCTSKTRPPANSMRFAGTPVFAATADAISSRARSAAWIAALPIISVTRLE